MIFRKKKKVTSIVEVLSKSPGPFVGFNVRKIVSKGNYVIIPRFFVWKTICKLFKFTLYEVIILKLIKIQKKNHVLLKFIHLILKMMFLEKYFLNDFSYDNLDFLKNNYFNSQEWLRLGSRFIKRHCKIWFSLDHFMIESWSWFRFIQCFRKM